MRLNLMLGIIVVLALSLQGCGKKGPLKLPSAQSYAAQAMQSSQTSYISRTDS
ncbi:MAG TPA: lipoprotein [Gallionella sp.]|nr:lipoprotein [Gallionella sp.]